MERNRDPWIKDCGTATEDELRALAIEALQPGTIFLALQTDAMLCGKAEAFSKATPDRLLELRVFDETRELWAHRSATGREFAWRIADDAALEETLAAGGETGFFANPENYRMEITQYLDIDGTYKLPIESNRKLRTTGSGYYELPITDDDAAVRLVQYIRYDEPACAARVVDFRIKGFCRGEDKQ